MEDEEVSDGRGMGGGGGGGGDGRRWDERKIGGSRDGDGDPRAEGRDESLCARCEDQHVNTEMGKTTFHSQLTPQTPVFPRNVRRCVTLIVMFPMNKCSCMC